MPNFTTFHQAVLWAAIDSNGSIIIIIINIAASSNVGVKQNALDKLILLDGRYRLGGYMTTVSVIGNTTAGGMSIMRVRVNVYQMGK